MNKVSFFIVVFLGLFSLEGSAQYGALLSRTTPPSGSCPTSTDTAFQNIIDYACTQGYTFPASGALTCMEELRVDLETAGAWDEVYIMFVFRGANNTDFANINWKNPGATAGSISTSGTITYADATGYSKGAANAYVNLNWNYYDDCGSCSVTDAQIVGHFNDMNTSSGSVEAMFGGGDSTSDVYLGIDGTTYRGKFQTTSQPSQSGGQSNEVVGLRKNAANQFYIIQGTSASVEGGETDGSRTSDDDIWLFCTNNAGSVALDHATGLDCYAIIAGLNIGSSEWSQPLIDYETCIDAL